MYLVRIGALILIQGTQRIVLSLITLVRSLPQVAARPCNNLKSSAK